MQLSFDICMGTIGKSSSLKIKKEVLIAVLYSLCIVAIIVWLRWIQDLSNPQSEFTQRPAAEADY